MKTSEFEYYVFPFEEFNEPQSEVIPHVTEDKNIVVSFPTASGKTVIAEAVFSHALSCGKKCVYVSPFKALSNEKHESWKNTTLSSKGIVVSTSDYSVKSDEFRKSSLLLFTMESFDSKTRSIAHQNWLKEVGVLVLDEAHMIGSVGRGDKLEMALMRYTLLNPDCRLVLLSATMPNAQQLSDWVKRLNGKDTLCFESNWRPVQPKINLYEATNSWQELFEGISGVLKSSNGKVIVFVHSKKKGKELGKVLLKEGIRCAFHHGSLSLGKRKKIEGMFSEDLDVLISTSTLSSGVNL